MRSLLGSLEAEQAQACPSASPPKRGAPGALVACRTGPRSSVSLRYEEPRAGHSPPEVSHHSRAEELNHLPPPAGCALPNAYLWPAWLQGTAGSGETRWEIHAQCFGFFY